MASSSSTKPTPIIAILDAGAQYAKVIDRRIRALHVRSEIYPLDVDPQLLITAHPAPAPTPAHATLLQVVGVVISGGPQSVHDASNAPRYHADLFATLRAHKVPILGICYGCQLLNHAAGGVVAGGAVRQDGTFAITLHEPRSRLFRGIDEQPIVLLTHGDSVQQLAPGFWLSATTTHSGIVAAVEHNTLPWYGVQFHPEVDLTDCGMVLFRNFLFDIVQVEATFTLTNRLDVLLADIRAAVGDDLSVLVLVSGGVDSSVCAALLSRALPPERVFALHIDSGFMRLNESKLVEEALGPLKLNLKVVDAVERFAQATTVLENEERTLQLRETVDPEHKRKIIGDAFMHISEEYVDTFHLDASRVLLCQGTLRPDLIESASDSISSNAAVIKTHHNDTALVRTLRRAGRIIEPLKDYHKDEVRELGLSLGLPEGLVWRQPFPGPGLAIRTLCAEEPFFTPFDEEIIANLAKVVPDDDIHATLVPCRTVGVQGDARSYSNIVALSTAGDPDWDRLLHLAKLIPATLHHVNRIVYVFGEQLQETHLRTITPTHLVPEVVDQLRAADAVVNNILLKYKLMKKLSQVPVILFPCDFGRQGCRSIAIRTFITNDFMTGRPAVPGKDIDLAVLQEMVAGILADDTIARVVFDLTAKPPGTTEWE